MDLRIDATWIHALVPVQVTPAAGVSWDEIRVSGNETLAKRTSAKLVASEALLPQMGGVYLRKALDDNGLWTDRDHVTVEELCEWFPRYLYLPRVRDRDTILAAVREGAAVLIADDTFATAEVDVTMEIQVRVAGGVDDRVVRIVSENAAALRFEHAGFESE